ncbi:hypothetical protein V498_03548 [Pseudogymnoascus sp. VKM F-4517 (FW-2822)]|nr:hypothetical protein V498_03548 [Pseudogymnoascus sp. VKM F-4517 (FW-2822)]
MAIFDSTKDFTISALAVASESRATGPKAQAKGARIARHATNQAKVKLRMAGVEAREDERIGEDSGSSSWR